MLKVEFNAEARRTLRVVALWERRSRELLDRAANLAAEMALEGLLSRLPATDALRAYRGSLEVVRVKDARDPIYAVRLRAPLRASASFAAEETLLFVEPRKGFRRVPEGVRILARNNPWTVDTLPFVPEKKHARLVERRVDRATCRRAAEARRRSRQRWRRELDAAGVRDTGSTPVLPEGALRDLAWEALRMEFGLGGAEPRAHWRPAVREVAALVGRRLARDRTVANAFLRAGSTRLSDPLLVPQIRLSEISRFAEFQKRISSGL